MTLELAPTTSAAPALRTTTGPCPGCGEDAPVETWALPGQLLPRRQDFRAARCRRCGLAYLLDRVVDDDQARLYDLDYPLHRGPSLWGLFAPLVAAHMAGTDRRRVAALCRHLPDLGPEDAVLDVGCGRPTFLARLRRRTGARVHGLDAIADPAVYRAAERAGVVLHRGLPPALPPALDDAGPLTAATLWHALEHDPRPAETLRAIRARLAPEGRLLVEVPDSSGRPARLFPRRWGGLHTPRHASFFEPETLRRVVEGAGFEVLEHRRAGTLPPFVPVALGLVDAIGFRFRRHPAWLLFPAWAIGMGLTWPWLGRPSREGLGLQLLVARPKR